MPSGSGLELISFGYKNVLSHTLWFNTISYFGKHYKSDRNYEWLSHMCNLTTRLNPKMPHVYEFCSLMLAWEARDPQQSIKILDKAIEAYPLEWKFPYLRGMTYLIFLEDADAAKDDFVRSAKLPGAHRVIVKLAAKQISLRENNHTAIEFLEDMIKNSEQEWERGALIDRLEELRAKQAELSENEESN